MIAVMHSTMPKDIFSELHIKFTPKAGHNEMTFTELLETVLSIRFSESLAEILDADADVAYDHNHKRTSRKFSLKDGDVNSVYIYCDVLEHVTVGDTKAPLLRIVDKPKKKYGNVHETFNPILYVPLQKKNFDTVEINIMTDGGQPVPFRYGKSFVVLEFRRNVHSYLGLQKDTLIVIRVICHRDTVRTIRGKPYCCDASCHMYENYYSRQVGGQMPVFIGSRQQRGHGLGSV